MYATYLKYIQKPKNISKISKDLLYIHKCNHEIKTEVEKKELLDRYLFEYFLDEYSDDTFNVDTCVLKDFPQSLVANYMYNFIIDGHYIHWGAQQREIWKYFYFIYNNYISQSKHVDSLISKCFKKLKSLIKKFHTKDPIINRDYFYGKHWNLLSLIPLLDNDPGFITKISKFYLDDIQDSLMFGLAQYNIDFIPHLKNIMRWWTEHGNIEYDYGTGMIGQLEDVFNEYKRKGYDLYKDKEMHEILKVARFKVNDLNELEIIK